MQKNEAAESEALEAAENWLSLIDQDKINESWQQAASMFKTAVTAEQWQASVKAAQAGIGKPVSRRLKSKQYAEELPGVPDGEYVVIVFDTSYEKKKNGTETVTPMKDIDGQWRVAGYFVK
jgi:hypothetical protein